MGLRQELETLDTQELFGYIMAHEKYDDWRDAFQAIHNWGYNTDFTYNNITDPEHHSVKEYLIEYIMDGKEEEDGDE